MTSIERIQPMIAALEARANAIEPYSYAHLLCGADGWSVSISNLRINSRTHLDPFAALAVLDAALAKIEDRDGALARTLGIAA